MGALLAQVSFVVWSGPEVPALRGNDDGIHGRRIKGDISTRFKKPVMTQAWQPTNEQEVCMTVAQGTPSKFEYLLNALERATMQLMRSDYGYAGHRAKVLDYVTKLEAENAALSAQVVELTKRLADSMSHANASLLERATDAEAQVVELQRKAEMYPTIDSDGGREMEIMVNGENTLAVDGRVDKSGPLELTYGHIVGMAGYEPERILSVTYSTNRKGDEQRQGVLSPGRSVVVEEGMRFYVADTSNA